MAVQLQTNFPNFLPHTFNQKQAAAYLGMHPLTLKKYVAQGKIPAPVILGEKLIRYSRQVLDSWLESQKVAP